MTKIEINGKKYELADSFDELTLEEYCKAFYNLSQNDEEDVDESEKVKQTILNESKILSRLLGESDDFCLNLGIEDYKRLKDKISFIYDIDVFIKNAKAGITIEGRRYGVPRSDEMSLRQFIDADMTMNNKEDEMQYIELLSILLLEVGRDGKFKPYDGNYEELKGKLRKVKCTEALPLVYHFFKRSVALQKLTKAFMKEEVTQYLQPTQGS